MDELRNSSLSMVFGNIIVNNINHTSGIFVGENMQFGWSGHMKANHGFGFHMGYLNTAQINAVFIYDNDLIDAPITDYDIMSGSAIDTGSPVPVQCASPVTTP
ncbi:hypothetical protein NZD89_03245 [Alicyclobacillus fastidiosus]|uniref:Uncharacterized protein n=1 Tax=Alicyclobacillus fastidiosus TaxID=392011 RepID=A0ABY6ZIC6_9BACL|nr:hypothetical protein [Alicyclobacillus fastidiosus]WAH42520.1 hypothetical protein NZD89_03245 [Alicyclobacillus fastidiosus]